MTKKTMLSQLQIKFLVITLMFCGHIGHFLYPKTPLGQVADIVSQITGVTMAFFLVEGYYHTCSLYKYILRLLVCGVITQVFLFLLHETKLNICFSFALCLTILFVIDRSAINKYLKIIIVAALFVASFWCGGEILYPTLVVLLYAHRHGYMKLFSAFSIASLVSFLYNFSAVVYYSIIRKTVYYGYGIECILIFLIHSVGGYYIARYVYDGKRSHNNRATALAKYFFYVFYPIQFLVIYLIKYQFNGR